MSRLILLDLDGTLTTKDTMLAFAKKVGGPTRYYFSLLKIAPLWLASKFNIAATTRMKEKFLLGVLAGKTREELEKYGEDFALKDLPLLIKPGALEAIENWKNSGDIIVIVTASFDTWISAWTKSNGIDLLSSEMQWKKGVLVGIKRDCNREEKVNMVLEHYDLKMYDKVLAYGDSKGDREMLNLADQKYFRHFS